MKVNLYVSLVRSGHNTGDYPAGVRTTLAFSRKEALCDIIDFIELDAGNDDELIDQDTATEDDLEGRIEQAQDEGHFDSWGIDDFDIELPGTASEQIAAILHAHCERGDELHAEEILREARGQFIRESDHCPYCAAIGRSQDDCEGDECESRKAAEDDAK
jgi:hypothetical protein